MSERVFKAMETHAKYTNEIADQVVSLTKAMTVLINKVEQLETENRVHRGIMVDLGHRLNMTESEFIAMVDRAIDMSELQEKFENDDLPDEIKSKVDKMMADMMRGGASEH